MKKHILLFLIFCLLISCFGFTTVSAWIDGPEIINFGASSADIGYEPALAFDNNTGTMWHNQWNDYGEGGVAHNIYPQSLIAELDSIYWIDCIGYLPRQNAFNGTAYEYEIWVSTAGSVNDINTDENWTKVAEGIWNEDFWDEWRITEANSGWGGFVNADFDAIEAKLVKFKILGGVGGWASAAALEIGFLGADYTPMFGFTPKNLPGTPAPVFDEPATEAPVIFNETLAPVTPFPQTGETMMIIFVIISLSVAFAYRKITVKKLI